MLKLKSYGEWRDAISKQSGKINAPNQVFARQGQAPWLLVNFLLVSLEPALGLALCRDDLGFAGGAYDHPG